MDVTMSRGTAQSLTEQESVFQLVLLHLVPGAVITLVFALLAQVAMGQGWPASLALLITWLIAGIPLLLGILFYQGYRLNGRFSLHGILLNRQPLRLVQYLWLVPTLLGWTAVSSTLLYLLAERLHQTLFAWMPAWLNLLGRISQTGVGIPSRGTGFESQTAASPGNLRHAPDDRPTMG